MRKYIFVTGGVVSGLGKGLTAASLGRLLKQRGLKVASQKLDPYINVDPGTMSPYQHGEVFVTEDGAETDLDLGHYERFIDENLNKFSSLTAGRAYFNVIEKERRGEYSGETVQVIPHITNEIKSYVYSVGENVNADVVITEIGGTTGDIEGLPFLEAIRQLSVEVGHQNCIFIHVTLIPYIYGSNEYKSKPTQHSVKELRSLGINPNIIVARCDAPLNENIKNKISLFCNVKPDCVIENVNLDTLYEAPLMLEESNLSDIVCRELEITAEKPDLVEWKAMVESIKSTQKNITIAVVGKYVKLHDAYLSVAESLRHAGYEFSADVNLRWVDSELVTEFTQEELLSDCDGILVPGGFGSRGIEGKIQAIKYARENNLPFLGICLGMQLAAVEFSRNVLGLKDANSTEFNKDTLDPIIDLMLAEQLTKDKSGGIIRLGAYPCRIKKDTKIYDCYKTQEVFERHRHRYEFNNKYRESFEKNGMVFSGLSPDGSLVEALEDPSKNFFVGVQYHPEFKSRPNSPHPLFKGFVHAALAGK